MKTSQRNQPTTQVHKFLSLFQDMIQNETNKGVKKKLKDIWSKMVKKIDLDDEDFDYIENLNDKKYLLLSNVLKKIQEANHKLFEMLDDTLSVISGNVPETSNEIGMDGTLDDYFNTSDTKINFFIHGMSGNGYRRRYEDYDLTDKKQLQEYVDMVWEEYLGDKNENTNPKEIFTTDEIKKKAKALKRNNPDKYDKLIQKIKNKELDGKLMDELIHEKKNHKIQTILKEEVQDLVNKKVKVPSHIVQSIIDINKDQDFTPSTKLCKVLQDDDTLKYRNMRTIRNDLKKKFALNPKDAVWYGGDETGSCPLLSFLDNQVKRFENQHSAIKKMKNYTPINNRIDKHGRNRDFVSLSDIV